VLATDRETAAAIAGGLVAGSLLLVFVVRKSGSGPGIRDAADGDEILRQVAARLDGRFLERRLVPWHRRPYRYGLVEGRLDGSGYRLMILPARSEWNPGCAMVQFDPGVRRPGPGAERVVFVPEEIWHWPDRADPEVLADHVRRAAAATEPDG
jgi:hypothetical protein